MISHVLEGRLPSGRDLPEHAPALAKKLSDYVGEPLEPGMDALDKLDEYVLRRYREEGMKVFEELQDPSFYEPLFAFVGETLIKETGGEWRMIHDGDFDVWEPWIVKRENGYYLMYELARLCKEFVSPDPDSFSIWAVVDGLRRWPSRHPSGKT